MTPDVRDAEILALADLMDSARGDLEIDLTTKRRASISKALRASLPNQAGNTGREELIERLEMFVDHGAASMGDAQELMSDVLLEIKHATRLAAKPADEGVRMATIEECAVAAERFYDVDFPFRADAIDVGKTVCRQIASMLRALSSTGVPKP